MRFVDVPKIRCRNHPVRTVARFRKGGKPRGTTIALPKTFKKKRYRKIREVALKHELGEALMELVAHLCRTSDRNSCGLAAKDYYRSRLIRERGAQSECSVRPSASLPCWSSGCHIRCCDRYAGTVQLLLGSGQDKRGFGAVALRFRSSGGNWPDLWCCCRQPLQPRGAS